MGQKSLSLDDWDKLPAQSEFYDDNDTDILMMSAGLGSGKTHVLCRKMIKLSALNPGMSGAILCPTYKDFRRDVKPEMFDILTHEYDLQEKKHFWFDKSYSEFSFAWNRKPLYILTGEQPIAGPNLAYCGINEFSLIRLERIKEMLRRVRLKNAQYRQRCMVGTPEDVHNWLEDFVETQEAQNKKKPHNFKIVYADTRENHHIDPEYRAHLESMLDEQALKVFASGQIIRLGGQYFYYAFSRQKNIRPTPRLDGTVYVNLDFNVGKMAASFANIDYFNHPIYGQLKRLRIFDELMLKGNSDTPAMARAIIERFGLENVILTIDASGRNRKSTGRSDYICLLDEGFSREQVRFKSSNPRMRARQLLVNGLLSKEQIIVDPKCKLVIKDFEKVEQNSVDFTKIKDKDEKLTHFSDGIDYTCDFEFNMNLSRSSTIQL